MVARRIGMIAALGFAALVACCSPAATTTSSATTAASAPAPADSATAVAVVTALYQPYLKHTSASQPEPPAWYDAMPMSPELAALVHQDQVNTQQGDEGAIEADPIIAAQDYQLSDLSVTPDAPFADGRGSVTAHFKNMGHATDVHYDLVLRASDNAWLVDNVRSNPDYNLRTQLAPPAH